MGVSVLILGVSGTGKSTSLRNFKPDDIGLINVAGKPLPFKGKFNDVLRSDDYANIHRYLKASKKKSTVIDDAQYLMGNEFMRRVTEKGYDKFSELAKNFNDLLQCIRDLPDDRVVYLLGHIERDQDGNEKFKTMGKLIDQCISVEGTTTIVLKTAVTDGKYYFLTQNSGKDTVKSPMGMFPTYAIDNDLKYVDEKIRNYYEIGDFKSDDELVIADKDASTSLSKPDTSGRRSRTSTPADEGKKESSIPRQRKSRTEVDQENKEKVEAYGNDISAAIDNAARDREEIPFEEAASAIENIPEPNLDTPPRRTRKERSETINPPVDSAGSDEQTKPSESDTRGRRRRSR